MIPVTHIPNTSYGLTAAVRAMFSAGEQGWWYDPSNFSTLFQDSAGTTPVTAMEQPVGLQLDLSKGLVLGSALSITRWTNYASLPYETLTTSGASIISAVNSVSTGYAYTNKLNMVSGQWYRVEVNVGIVSGLAPQISTGSNGGTNNLGSLTNKQLSSGANTLYFSYNGDGNDYLWIFSGASASFSLTISVTPIAGNHRFQTTSANRPVVSARVNLLTKTEEFNDAAWTKSNATVTANSAVAPNGTTTADTLTATANLAHTLQAFTAVVGVSYTPSVYIKRRTGTGAIRMWNAAGTTVDVTSSVTSEWNQITVPSVAATSTGAFFFLQLSVSGDAIDIWGADLRVTNVGVNLPAYQRVNTSTDYDSTGFPIYIKPNGSNQFMQTNSINFTATDKMTVWQGVRKLSDAAAAVCAELSINSNNNSGAFLVTTPFVASTSYGFSVKGSGVPSAAVYTNSAVAAPVSNVLTGTGDIATDTILLRVNGSQVASSIVDIGTGNFGTYPAYFYMRAGTSLPFNGHDYGSIARGAASTAAQITTGETWINLKTKAYQS